MEREQLWRRIVIGGVAGRGRVAAGVLPRAALLVIRLAPAIVFLAHGYLKLLGGHHDRTVALFLTVNIPFAEPAAWLIGALELAGSLALLSGVLLRPFALLLAAEMAVAIVLVRLPQGFIGAWEFELVLLLVCLGLALWPTGQGSALRRQISP
jgi:putative oxidoreductase